MSGEELVARLRKFREHGVHVLGSFIFGLPSDRPSTFEATADIAERAGADVRAVRDADAVSRNRRFRGVGKELGDDAAQVGGIPITRHWLIPQAQRPEGVRAASGDVARRNPRANAGGVGSSSIACRRIWARSRCTSSLRARIGVRADFEALSADVREHRDRDRQRAGQPSEPVGASHRPNPAVVCSRRSRYPT